MKLPNLTGEENRDVEVYVKKLVDYFEAGDKVEISVDERNTPNYIRELKKLVHGTGWELILFPK